MRGVPAGSLTIATSGVVQVGVYLVEDGRSLSEDELKAFLLQHIAPFKVPVRLWQETESLPRLGTEKVDKRALKARYLPVWQAEQKTAG